MTAPSLASILQQRRQHLAQLVDFPVLLWSGCALSRNFPANRFPFRASSHFLYFAGLSLKNSVIRLEGGKLELFYDEAPPESALWHGEMPARSDLARTIGADAAYPLADLAFHCEDAATIPVSQVQTQQSQILQRAIALEGIDAQLAQAIATLRLSHDAGALEQLRQAAAIAVEAHKIGMGMVSHARTEAEVRGAIEGAIFARNMSCSYNSIVTVRGEVLHNERYDNLLQPGDLLLVDAGAETQMGWASDITRTFPVTGKFSATQREIYNLVLAAHDACIDRVSPGVEYSEIHHLAALVLAQGLVDLGILRGQADDLVERDAHALFFPHGIGHLLGLDVHDMEDLGDVAGYAPGRKRRDRFGWCYLRLDRPLQPGMLVTIEPGFYQVPGILQNPHWREKYQDCINWQQLERFGDVRGIRIEDDVLVTESGREVLSADLPNNADEIEQLVSANS
ncbi:aminopeptidase P N-terminal domain-containing protein [Lusitaniella coriacea]|uniref:aminopeptidase P N-terminal domain-containing protein n=1 Tax=Lusitaniella coriacea TaxID=1983105 RepID=UPI003CEFB64A